MKRPSRYVRDAIETVWGCVSDGKQFRTALDYGIKIKRDGMGWDGWMEGWMDWTKVWVWWVQGSPKQQATRDGRCYDMRYAGDVPNERYVSVTVLCSAIMCVPDCCAQWESRETSVVSFQPPAEIKCLGEL